MDAPEVVACLDKAKWLAVPEGTWIRIRGIADPLNAKEKGGTWAPKVESQRAALAQLHRWGLRICAFLPPPGKLWHSRTGSMPDASLPLDLREAHDWIARYAETYRGLVDEWEVGDEPDIGYLAENAESYAAFLKACYWGAGSNVLMAPLALPPGPYLEALVRNDFLSYTDGFNYHYYGYAGDFTGVYRQFQRAVQDLGREANIAVDRSAAELRTKQLPIFITEFGYGMLGTGAGETVDGRVRQWRWFKSVVSQVRSARLEGPMAFYLPPYLERGLSEFGLTVAFPAGSRPTYLPRDFGEKQAQPWMALIGRQFGNGEASPALAYLIDYGKRHPYKPKAWTVRVLEPSPVVLDFVAGPKMSAVKSSQGYVLLIRDAHQCEGSGEMRIYNFSNRVVAGRLAFSDSKNVSAVSGDLEKLELAPGEMRVLPIHLQVPLTRWEGVPWSVDFIPDEPREPMGRFSAKVYPDAAGMFGRLVTGFDYPETHALLRRQSRLAVAPVDEEPILTPDGRWLVTHGLSVDDSGETWRFQIDELPTTSLRPALAELAVPDGTMVPKDGLLMLQFRCLSAGTAPSRYTGLCATQGGLIQVQLRTTNGNLYEVSPRRQPKEAWQSYQEAVGNFTMSFYGRANLPWRMTENKVVALVFTFWPRTLPTEIEVQPIGFVQPAR